MRTVKITTIAIAAIIWTGLLIASGYVVYILSSPSEEAPGALILPAIAVPVSLFAVIGAVNLFRRLRSMRRNPLDAATCAAVASLISLVLSAVAFLVSGLLFAFASRFGLLLFIPLTIYIGLTLSPWITCNIID